jgi:hypothetical protein
MYEIYHQNPDALKAELAYRRSMLIGLRGQPPAPRGRWWRQRSQRTV